MANKTVLGVGGFAILQHMLLYKTEAYMNNLPHVVLAELVNDCLPVKFNTSITYKVSSLANEASTISTVGYEHRGMLTDHQATGMASSTTTIRRLRDSLDEELEEGEGGIGVLHQASS